MRFIVKGELRSDILIKALEGSPYILERLSRLQIEKNKRTCQQIPIHVRVMANKILECSSND